MTDAIDIDTTRLVFRSRAENELRRRDRLWDTDRPTALYRFFNVGGDLLYVGISFDPDARLLQHAADKPWMDYAALRTVEWLPNRAEALRREAEVIFLEQPRYNRDRPTTEVEGVWRQAIELEPRLSEFVPPFCNVDWAVSVNAHLKHLVGPERQCVGSRDSDAELWLTHPNVHGICRDVLTFPMPHHCPCGCDSEWAEQEAEYSEWVREMT